MKLTTPIFSCSLLEKRTVVEQHCTASRELNQIAVRFLLTSDLGKYVLVVCPLKLWRYILSLSDGRLYVLHDCLASSLISSQPPSLTIFRHMWHHSRSIGRASASLFGLIFEYISPAPYGNICSLVAYLWGWDYNFLCWLPQLNNSLLKL